MMRITQYPVGDKVEVEHLQRADEEGEASKEAGQHAADVTTSLLSLGWNRSLLGWKCDPDLPGLRDHFVFVF
jgi:hypothetical protein